MGKDEEQERRNVINWRWEHAIMENQNSLSKKDTCNYFISGTDYRTDGPKAYRLCSSLNNKHSTKQSQPWKVNDEEITDKTGIVSKFNTFYLAQHKLEPNRMKKEKIHRKQNGANRGDGHLKDLFIKRIHNGGVKGSNKKTLATRNNQDLTKYSQNL